MQVQPWTPQAVIFDMDGLLLDTERIGFRAWQRASRDFGFDLSEHLYCKVIGRTKQDTFQIFRESFGLGFNPEEVRAKRLLYGAEIIAQEGVPLKPGALQLLDALNKRNIKLALATSTERERTLAYLEQAKLLSFFKAIVTGDQVKIGKPDPEIYLKCAQALSVLPESCLVFEDSESGTIAAHKAGMRVIIVPDMKKPSDEVSKLAWLLLPSLQDAEKHLQTLFVIQN